MFNEKTGKLVNLKLVHEDEDVMIIADSGIIIRIAAKDISKIGRDTQGVRVMKLSEGKVAVVAVTPHGEEKEEGETAEENAGGEESPSSEE